MERRRSVYFLACLWVVALPWLTVSCAKKTVQGDQTVIPRESMETTGVAEETDEVPSTTGGGPSEAALPEEEQFREETFEFTNEDIHFAFDRYDLKPEARETLAEKAFYLKKYPSVEILIEGHCDERGTNEYNLALGERRANSAKQYLINLGIVEDRISTISYGEERPLDPRHAEEAWAKNRRAHFEIITD